MIVSKTRIKRVRMRSRGDLQKVTAESQGGAHLTLHFPILRSSPIPWIFRDVTPTPFRIWLCSLSFLHFGCRRGLALRLQSQPSLASPRLAPKYPANTAVRLAERDSPTIATHSVFRSDALKDPWCELPPNGWPDIKK